MWFKNLQVFRFTKPFNHSPEALADKLAAQPFRPCGSQELSRIGFVPPVVEDGDLVHSANGFILLCLKKQQRVLPSGAVNEAVAAKVSDIEKNENRNVGRKERQQIKEELIITMLPKAFTRSSLLHAYIAPADGYLVINSGSATAAEELLVLLRDVLGSLPVIPAISKSLPPQVMTHWLKQQPSVAGFSLGYECELRDPGEDGGVIRCKNQLLTNANIINHLDEGMMVTKLAIVSEAGIQCVVDENLAVKRLVFGDLIQDKAAGEDPQTAAEEFDVDFTLMTLELRVFLQQLFALFGGEDLTACEDEILAAVGQ